MALEDYDETGQEPEIEPGRVDLDPSEGAAEEDLFDIAPLEDEDAQGAHSLTPGTSTDQPPALIPGTPGTPGYDPELDKDIFNFNTTFTGAQASLQAAPVSTFTPAVEPQAEAPTAEVPQGSSNAEEVAVAPTIRAEAREARRDRLVLALAGGFLLANTALILFAWQANRSFQANIVEASRTIADGLARSSTLAHAATAPGRAQTQVASPAPAASYQAPVALGSHAEHTITIAQAMLEGGRYIDARRSLSNLLANSDRLRLDRELIAEAEFLIAESYELQGYSLLEGESR